ncbi:MAG TPA: 23S rRNA (uracil(1939)-C(5))-methyltransferase RlmD, partial [Candidatus Binataceae bacterium]|nr:23S rRNA (uracil(1939)-C(5))-methyltransferase RlmD [Candidatus Binataceae bacterium]
RCGGCDWQHIDYQSQVRFKAKLIAHEIERAIGREIDPVGLVEPAAAEFGYRSRIRFQVGPRGAIGFHEFSSNRLVEVDSCLVAWPEMRLPLHLARSLGTRVVEIEVVSAGTREVLAAHLNRRAGAEETRRARHVLESDPKIAGIVLRSGMHREIIGDATVMIELEGGLALEVDADLFSQVNREQNRKLIATVMTMAAPHDNSALLDLFCGAGNFSLPAARRGARVTGVDADIAAVAAAAKNARRLGFDTAQFSAIKASEVAGFLHRARYRAEIAILDPPRTGAAELIEPLLKLRPRTIVYVSCDAPTLSRDLRRLSDNGYRLAAVRAFDFFPNTHHAEIAVQLVLT